MSKLPEYLPMVQQRLTLVPPIVGQHFIDLGLDSPHRYNLIRLVRNEQGVHDEFTSYFLDQVRLLPVGGKYKIESHTMRPEVYSRDIYRDQDMWEILLHYNDIVSTNSLFVGRVLQYPLLRDIEELYFSLRARS